MYYARMRRNQPFQVAFQMVNKMTMISREAEQRQKWEVEAEGKETVRTRLGEIKVK